jgi:hypothetical protein
MVKSRNESLLKPQEAKIILITHMRMIIHLYTRYPMFLCSLEQKGITVLFPLRSSYHAGLTVHKFNVK